MSAKKILIIDDETEVCLLLKNYLLKKQLQVECSCSLTEGLELFPRMKPDHIILDNNLPDGFGIDSIATFRKLDPDVRILLISARSDLRDEAVQKGADSFLEKPISFSALNSILGLGTGENNPA